MVYLRKEFPEKHRPVTGNDVFPEGVDEKLTAEIIGVVADHFNEVSQYRYSLRQPLDFRTQFFAIPDSPEQIVIAVKIVMKLVPVFPTPAACDGRMLHNGRIRVVVACFGKGGKIERFDPVLGIAGRLVDDRS